ncbi:MAG: hypothetical protein Q8O93_04965 [bacterium]|nr:hypothetical protein [bacterium]
MADKAKPQSGKKDNEKKAELIKLKINNFLLNYFNYLALTAGIIIFMAGVPMFIYPKYRQIAADSRELETNLQAEYESKFNYLSSIRNLKKSYQLISQSDRTKIINMVPALNDTGAIISEVEAIALKNSAILNSVRIAAVDGGNRSSLQAVTGEKKDPPAGAFVNPPSGIGRVKLEINLYSVNYQVLKNIIKSFENSVRLYDLARVDFDAKNKTAKFDVYSYYLSP